MLQVIIGLAKSESQVLFAKRSSVVDLIRTHRLRISSPDLSRTMTKGEEKLPPALHAKHLSFGRPKALKSKGSCDKLESDAEVDLAL